MFTKFIGSALKIKYGVFRKQQPINIVAALANSNNVLIYMPDKIDQFGTALKALQELRKVRPKWKISVITKHEMISFFDKKLKLDLFPYSKNDVNILGLPKQTFKKLFRNATFDLALDLQLEMDVLSIVLFKLSNAPLRVCFDHQSKSPFYNLGIRVNAAETLKDKYSAMVKYITIVPGNSQKPQKAAKKT